MHHVKGDLGSLIMKRLNIAVTLQHSNSAVLKTLTNIYLNQKSQSH